jgi:DNA-binding response OmpR family regulator
LQDTSLAGRTVLVVEDEVLIAMEIVLALEGSGAIVMNAGTLDRATQCVEREGLSAAVLDFGLHGGDADGLCAWLNERDIPYVLHSGYGSFGDHCHRGVVVPKPASPLVLVEALVQLLGGRNDGNPSALCQKSDLRP